MQDTPRYKGARWTIVYGSYSGIEQTALNDMNSILRRYMPYVPKCVTADGYVKEKGNNVILLGTPKNNHLIAEAVRKGIISIPDNPQGYAIYCGNSPWVKGRRCIIIAGRTATGVLYGTADFDAKTGNLMNIPQKPTLDRLRKVFDSLPDMKISEAPLIENRGIWTWGYVIYDYKRFIDNMARLRMNMLTIWNDCVPVNIDEILQYAHSRGVKVILGFHWGWGLKLDLSKAKDRRKIKEIVLKEYETNYSKINHDGIYFQTITEHNDTMIGGKSVASLACGMVNEISRALLKRHPGLSIQFGLHATSILGNYVDLAPLDPRVMIVWEDAGTLPYPYSPDGSTNHTLHESLNSYEKTIEYSRKIATFRKGTPFALVPKGWTCLDWTDEFEHHDSFIMGEYDRQFIREQLVGRQARWDSVNAMWFKHYPQAIKFYREMLKCRPASITATALIEDGVFEERIQPSVALLAETLWNPNRSQEEILQAAMSPVYSR